MEDWIKFIIGGVVACCVLLLTVVILAVWMRSPKKNRSKARVERPKPSSVMESMLDRLIDANPKATREELDSQIRGWIAETLQYDAEGKEKLKRQLSEALDKQFE